MAEETFDCGDRTLLVIRAMGFDGIFINNFGNIILIWAIFLGVYLICYLMKKYLRGLPNPVRSFIEFYVKWFEWSGLKVLGGEVRGATGSLRSWFDSTLRFLELDMIRVLGWERMGLRKTNTPQAG